MTFIDNVVEIETKLGTCYPQWSDYGCSYTYSVVHYFSNGEFKAQSFNNETIDSDVQKEEFDYSMASQEIIDLYKKQKEQQRFKESVGYGAYNAIPGDIVEVCAGRKYPKGLRGHVVKFDTWEKYSHSQRYLICLNLGDEAYGRWIKIPVQNAFICGHQQIVYKGKVVAK